VLVSVCTLGYALVVDPKLGYARDWDLFAFSGLGYTFLGLYLFLRYVKGLRKEALRYLTISLVFTSLVSTIPWIYVNSTDAKAVARFEHLLNLDMERSAYGRENLAMYYSKKGELQKEIEQWRKAIALTNNASYITNLAVVYYNLQRYDLALRELERSLDADSTFHFAHYLLAEIHLRRGEQQGAIEEYRKAIKYRSDITQYYDNLGSLLANLGRYPEALEVFQQGLKANPGYPSIYRNLGYTHLNMGDFAEAERYLLLYLEHSPSAEDVAEVREVLRNLVREKTKE
jgi:tetratricopeptide (TPR) repeat protein